MIIEICITAFLVVLGKYIGCQETKLETINLE